jgi:hypothetical protein
MSSILQRSLFFSSLRLDWKGLSSGLPDGLFSDQKCQFLVYFFLGLGMENLGTFLWPFRYFQAHSAKKNLATLVELSPSPVSLLESLQRKFPSSLSLRLGNKLCFFTPFLPKWISPFFCLYTVCRSNKDDSKGFEQIFLHNLPHYVDFHPILSNGKGPESRSLNSPTSGVKKSPLSGVRGALQVALKRALQVELKEPFMWR